MELNALTYCFPTADRNVKLVESNALAAAISISIPFWCKPQKQTNNSLGRRQTPHNPKSSSSVRQPSHTRRQNSRLCSNIWYLPGIGQTEYRIYSDASKCRTHLASTLQLTTKNSVWNRLNWFTRTSVRRSQRRLAVKR